MKGVIEANASNFAEIVSKSETPIIVDFFAEWCGPCRQLKPHIERLAADYDGKVLVLKVDVDQNMELAAEYGVSGLPTVLSIRDGKIFDRRAGMQTTTDLKRFADQAISGQK